MTARRPTRTGLVFLLFLALSAEAGGAELTDARNRPRGDRFIEGA